MIGIDGASWDIVDSLIKEGRLPTISKLILNGVSGDLESSIPFLSSPAWKCYSTGKNPGKLGVYSFHCFTKDEEIKPANSKSFKSRELWDYLSYKGVSSCVINVPMTFPPHPIKGVMISGIPALTHLEYTYPSHIKDILSKKINYDINPKKVFPEIKSVAKEIKKRFDAVKILIKNYNMKFDFIQITVFCVDNIAHEHWNNGRWDPLLLGTWEIIDLEIKNFISSYLDENWNIIVVSDHGMTSIKGVVCVNQWLKDQGYVEYHKKKKSLTFMQCLLKLFKINKLKVNKIYSLFQKLKIIYPFELLLGHEKFDLIARRLVLMAQNPKIEFTNTDINLKSSSAFCIGHGIYLLKTNNYKELRAELISKLEKAEDPENGNKIFSKVKRREDVYTGEYLHLSPDIILIPNEGYKITEGINRDNKIFYRKDEKWQGDHKISGIFIANGPNIKRGIEIQKAKIYDIAPTILHIFDLPIPNDMDGRVLTKIFEEDSEFAKREPRYVDPNYYRKKNEREKIKEEIDKLRKSGKI